MEPLMSWNPSLIHECMISVIFLALVNAIVLKPALMDDANRRVATVYGLTPKEGLRKRKCREPCGAPLLVIVSNSRPVSIRASSPGFAIVAEQAMKTGSLP